MSEQISIIGGGPWGVALARAAARGGNHVVHYTRRGDERSGRALRVTSSLEDAAKASRLLVLAVPTSVVREVARALGEHIDGGHLVVHGIRGLASDLSTMSDILREETPARRMGALGGPVQAAELVEGRPSAMVVGSPYPEVTKAVTAAFQAAWLRVYPIADLRGLEWASALVGALSIGVGFADEAGAGPGLLAALIARAMGDAAKIAGAAGADEKTLLGLGGYGDLLASIALKDRPEVVIGRALARGRSVDEAIAEASLRVEAIELIPKVVAFAKRERIATPTFDGLQRMLEGGKPEDMLHRFLAA